MTGLKTVNVLLGVTQRCDAAPNDHFAVDFVCYNCEGGTTI